MDNELLGKMKEEASKRERMTPRTVRLDPVIDEEIHEFADSHDLDFSIVVRAVLKLGWTAFNQK